MCLRWMFSDSYVGTGKTHTLIEIIRQLLFPRGKDMPESVKPAQNSADSGIRLPVFQAESFQGVIPRVLISL